MVIDSVAAWNTRAAKPARRLERYDDGLAQEVLPCSARIFPSRQCLSSALQWPRVQRHNRIREVGDRRPRALLLRLRRRMRRPHHTWQPHHTRPLPRMPHPLRTLRHRGPRLPHIQRPLRTSLRRGTPHQPPRRGTRKRPALFRNNLPVPAGARQLQPWRGTRRRRLRLQRSRKSAAAMPAAAVTRKLHNRTSGKIWPARADRAALPPRLRPHPAAVTPLDNKP
jgi:hypothetical protein